MNLKFYNPITPSQRSLVRLSNKYLEKSPLLKKSITKKINKAGRNNSGKITVYHKGGGTKKRYRTLFSQFSLRSPLSCIVTSVEYDPYRTSNVASIYSKETKNNYYILAPLFLKIGDLVVLNSLGETRLGYKLILEDIPIGTFLHNISTRPFSKGLLSRSAGTFAILVEKKQTFGILKLSSQKYIKLSLKCTASIGIVSNQELFLTNKGKAGRSRWLNNRPTVRGVAMNPVDHPHGGGEGKTSGGRTSVTPWGKPTKSKKN